MGKARDALAVNILVANVAYAARLVMPLLLLPVLAHRLDVADYGVYMYAMATAQWLGLFIEFGFNLSATRQVSSALTSNAIAFIATDTQNARLTLAAGTSLPALGLLLWSPQFAAAPQWVVVAWAYGALSALVPQYYFQGTHRLRDIASAELVSAIATLGLVASLVTQSNQALMLPLLVLAPRLVTTCYLTARMHRLLGDSRIGTYSFTSARRSLSVGLGLFKFQIYVSLYTSFNLILAGHFFSPTQIGAYASADRIMRAGLGFFSQISAAIFPKFVAMRAAGDSNLAGARLIAIAGMLSLGVIGAAITWFAAPALSRILFGNTHELAAEILRIQAMVVPAIAISSAISFHFLLVDGQDSRLNRVVLVAAAANVPICMILMTRQGVQGGAVSWVVIEWAIAAMLITMTLLQHNTNRTKEEK
ncbi:oligosaccharide flippase family protein [Roseateles sp. PN1]|uniref:oligosaccharide flippase family protein n=1 Tax=Roseateles sp. PN1 TaxID=3137372 RepID=UPI003138B680